MGKSLGLGGEREGGERWEEGEIIIVILRSSTCFPVLQQLR